MITGTPLAAFQGPIRHLSLTITDAILFHSGQAATSVTNFNGLSATQKAKLLAFLKSL